MRSRALDLLRSLAELVLDGKAYGLVCYPSTEIREELNGMKDYKAFLEKALGLKVFKSSWNEYEALVGKECLKIIFGERNWKIESVSLSLAPLESCSKEFLAHLLRNEMWAKEVEA